MLHVKHSCILTVTPMAKSITLKPNSQLLNPNFDGYKLSVDADVTCFQQNLCDSLESKKTISSCYLRTRLEALHNHLFRDPFHPEHVYYFTARGHLVKHHYSKDTRLSDGEVVWQADMTGQETEKADEESDNKNYYASLHFPTEELAVVSNGQGSLHLLETGDRSAIQSWLECYDTNTANGMIAHTYLQSGEDHQQHLHCLLVSVSSQCDMINNDKYTIVDEALKKDKGIAVHLLQWLVITYNETPETEAARRKNRFVIHRRTYRDEIPEWRHEDDQKHHSAHLNESPSNFPSPAVSMIGHQGSEDGGTVDGDDSRQHTSLSFYGASWEITRTRTLAGRGTIEYCAFDPSAEGIILLCHSNYSFVEDTLHPIPIQVPELEAKKIEPTGPTFTYMQNDEDVTVWLNVGQCTKEHLAVKVLPKELSVTIHSSVVLEGKLINPVHADQVTWTISEGKLELTLPKANEGLRWECLLEGDKASGEEVFDQQMLEEVNQRLAHLTSETLNDVPELDKPAFNPGELEACDEAQEDLLLLHLHGTTHTTAALGQLGATQHLFNAHVYGNTLPAFCTRYDVDGVLWQPEEGNKYTHTATFNAFGYVKASKTMAKFTCAAPDNSFVAIADVKSHIYVFFQSEACGGELRNRKSGKLMTTVARQLVISMKSHDEILGLHASTNTLFVLTSNTVFAYALRS